MNVRRIALVLAWVVVARVYAEDRDARVAWLAKNAVRIQSIDPSDDHFEDLEPLRATLKNVRIVMLGEQNHGDGTTFPTKTRLIRFLHERLGFDVLAFESGMYDCAKAWELIAKEPPRIAVARGIFKIWSASRQVQPLADYIGAQAKTSHPLELAGVDLQFSGTASKDFLVNDLGAFLSSIDPTLAKGAEWDRVARVINDLATYSETVPSPEEQAAFTKTIERWRSRIPERRGTNAFWRQFLASFRVFADQTWKSDPDGRSPDPNVFAMRDRQMGKNLIWLAKERYPNRKIIVWGATFHNARNLDMIETNDPKIAPMYKVNKPMGEVAAKEFGKQLYSIGVITHEGEYAFAWAKQANAIPTPSHDSLEDLFARAELDKAFVDFRRAPQWLRTPMAAQMVGHQEMRADWTRVVDGVVFLRTMQRSQKNE